LLPPNIKSTGMTPSFVFAFLNVIPIWSIEHRQKRYNVPVLKVPLRRKLSSETIYGRKKKRLQIDVPTVTAVPTSTASPTAFPTVTAVPTSTASPTTSPTSYATTICSTMIPPSTLPPDDSNCWKWWDVFIDGELIPPPPQKGCDYAPCQDAVCECDSYCCKTVWDLSCRGYELKSGDTTSSNYFSNGCSARLLCCEQETSFPKPPMVISNPPPTTCSPGEEDCCATMKPPSILARDDSTCWQWWDAFADGKISPDAPPPTKGCDYEPCQEAVCECDDYCCRVAWDLSCRGYELEPGDTGTNYFVEGCSARVLCCEQDSAFPKPPKLTNGTTSSTDFPIVIVGGDTDSYGCIPSAGYSWCESLQECLRPWETECDIAETSKEASPSPIILIPLSESPTFLKTTPISNVPIQQPTVPTPPNLTAEP